MRKSVLFLLRIPALLLQKGSGSKDCLQAGKRPVRSLLSVLALILAFLPGMSRSVLAADGDDPITRDYGSYTFTKISNPASGERQPDGINTNDLTGFPANRLNSYAWAVASRGNYIYIGTNRTLFGASLNSVAKSIADQNPDTLFTKELLNNAVDLITGGDVPVNLADEEYIPQIIRFDPANGTSKVIYQPQTKRGEDGVLYYTDQQGSILNNADVSAETASFRSVVEYRGNLYFGSLGVHMLQLIRVDQDDKADVVYQTIGLTSSLRAGCTYDDGTGETVYFGGQDTTYPKWRQQWGNALPAQRPLPIVIRRLAPETAGTDAENWNTLVADYEDFGEYARATVYASGGGNVWDLCSYNGRLYLILAYDGGWALFRGEKGGVKPNSFGWTWTEIVGRNGKYPLAMDENVETLNEQYRADYGCSRSDYGECLIMNPTSSGLLESAATPFVFQGKMYIGSFDNATSIQTQTVTKALSKLSCMLQLQKSPKLSQIFGPIYEVMAHPQRMWVMDENENIRPVTPANLLLEGTTNDYVWRFIEHNGKLYAGTFDSSSVYAYYLGLTPERTLRWLDSNGIQLPERIRGLLDGSVLERIQELLNMLPKDADAEQDEKELAYSGAAEKAVTSLEKFYQDEYEVEDILDDMLALQAARDDLYGAEDQLAGKAPEEKVFGEGMDSLKDLIDDILNFFDIDGLRYWVSARKIIKNARKGFDLLVTEDGYHWNRVVDNGLEDPYNYGARTFAVLNDELYLGTANPYFGAQLWKITDNTPVPPEPVPPAPQPDDPETSFVRLCSDCILPNTGFSSRHATDLALKPETLEYRNMGFFLQIPSLNVGTDLVEIPFEDNAWPVEWLGSNAGLLAGSAEPGKGYSVIAAHNTLNTTEYGPFAALSSLQENDRIFVSGADGDMMSFSVFANELLEPDGFDVLAAIAEREPGSLVLVTCENESIGGGYLNRRVVFAKPL